MALWFVTERPVVGRVFVAHRHGLVLATKLAAPPGGPPMDAEGFVDYLRREFGVIAEQDRSPASSWPFSEAREPFQTTDLVDLSRLTDFQRRVMMATACIPPGELRTYGEVAKRLEQPNAAMAVGQAMKSNPAPLVIPCHRVVGAGKLGGWVYGQNLKRSLLADEGVHLPIGSADSPVMATAAPSASMSLSLEERIWRGESQRMEFKTSAGWRGWRVDQHEIVKTVCGFLNAQGGELIIGVRDNGSSAGLRRDLPPGKQFDADKYVLFVGQELLKLRLHTLTAGLVSIHIEDYEGLPVCVVDVKPSPDHPVFAQPLANDGKSWRQIHSDKWDFWVRDINATVLYEGEKLTRYVRRRWPKA